MKRIGLIKNTKGLKGELRISLDFELDIDQIESIFIEEKSDSFIPYSIEDLHIQQNNLQEYILKLEGLDNVSEVEQFKKKFIALPEDEFKRVLFSTDFESFIDFQCFNDNEPIGQIIDVLENTAQPLLLINYQEKEVMIPFVDSFILEINHEEKQIFLSLPLGLLDL